MPASTGALPLTTLSEEEQMFQGAVRDFAEQAIRPRVHAMEQAAKIDPTLIPKFFELGLMGIEIPEAHGGAKGGVQASHVRGAHDGMFGIRRAKLMRVPYGLTRMARARA